MKYILLLSTLLASQLIIAQQKFMWGTASASYQVEGNISADGKGVSNWDVYTNKYEVTKSFTGKNQTGNVSVDQYNRKQYMKDFALMKDLGITDYRISLSWARFLPQGTGQVNKKGIEHYIRFIDDLKSFGIEPCVTLYHWDMPQALEEKGGWHNPKSIDWFVEYSNLVFKHLGTKVKTWITFNEPYIDLYLIENLVKNVKDKNPIPFTITSEQLAHQVTAAQHWMKANAIVINNYHKLNLGGNIGITLSLSPTIVKDEKNKLDILAAHRQDGLHNRWFLNAALKGTYPKDIVKLFEQYKVKIVPLEKTIKKLPYWKPDFIGVNFYAPSIVSYDEKFAMQCNWMTNNPDTIPMFNGYVRPDYLYKLLMRLKEEYNDPNIIITENGAGFGDRDDTLVDGKVEDNLRTKYIIDHVNAALQAKKDGAKLQGYFVWSVLDNFEWISGYDRRFGIVYVNFNTQERIPKKSYYTYQQIIKNNK